MAGTDEPYSLVEDSLVWDHKQEAGAQAVVFNIVLDTSEVIGLTDATPIVESMVDTSTAVDLKFVEPIFVNGRPTVAVESNVEAAASGSSVTLTAIAVDSVIDNADMSFSWKQIQGPTVELSSTDDTISFVVPEIVNQDQISFEIVGSNGDKLSLPVVASVYIVPVPEQAPVEDEPVAETPVEEPVTETPVEETPIEEPVTETPTEETPAVPAPAPAPVTEEADKSSSGGSTGLFMLALSMFGLMARRRK